jgi:hypothetical protein
MAYDPKRKRVLMFGGSPFADSTWSWDGAEWLQSAPPVAPVPRNDPSIVLDARRGRIILFGGDIPSGGDLLSLRDTWEWDGQAWVETTPTMSPIFSQRGAGAFDVDRGRFVYFVEGETWEYAASGGSCTKDAECDTGHCVDGVCCEVASCGTCEVCAVGSAHTECTKVAKGQLDDSCEGACDGNGACKAKGGTACTSGDTCATGFCAAGVCCAATSCAPFTCGSDGACKTSCADDADCAESLRCDVTTHACVAGGSCDPDGVTAIHTDGTREACLPFRCAAGACKKSCATNDDCASQNAVCDELGACVPPPAFTPFTRCALSRPLGARERGSERDGNFPFLLVLAIPLVRGVRRRFG